MSNRVSLLLLSLCLVSPIFQQRVDADPNPAAWIDKQMPELQSTYRWFHENPELSYEEEQTAARIAKIWKDDGFTVTSGVGGHGVVGILKNGEGPTLMLRCDLDGLPVTERTQLPYASTKRVELANGTNAGVMHACGHDIHMTNLIGVARYLSQHRREWSGTLMLVAQPAEERGGGARAMLKDGLFERFPRPDYAIALHVGADKRAGAVGVLAGYAMANVDSVDITLKGRAGHGSAPHTSIDPVVQAAELVVALQTIVSREVDPIEPAVVTVGSIHGGTKHNVIGSECHLQLTVRTYSEQVRAQVLEAIKRKAKAIAILNRAPEPDIKIDTGTPSLKNDGQLAARVRKIFMDTIGDDNVGQDPPSMGGEDFSRYGRAGVPILMYRLGSVSQKRLDRFEQLGVPPPSLHSDTYYPDVEPTLRTGISTMTAAALDLLQN